jgi:hypothetical protein
VTVAAEPGETTLNIPSASDEQVRAIGALRASMAGVLSAMQRGSGCKNGKTVFFGPAEAFQDLWNRTLGTFAPLLLPQFQGVSSAVAMLTGGIEKDGKWGPQMAWCCSILDAWQRHGITLPPARACNVALWVASYPETVDMLQVRVTNSLGEVPDKPAAPAQQQQQQQQQQPQSPVQQHQFQQDELVLGTKAGASGVPMWAWVVVAGAAVGGGYLAWRYIR